MEVWVRSQDKEQLVPMRGLRYKREEYKQTKQFGDFAEETQLFCDYDIVVKHYIYSDYYVDILGEYPTKERCLEIIDEIQGALCGNVCKYKGTGFVDKVTIEPINENVVAVINKEIIELTNHDTFVYEMPKE